MRKLILIAAIAMIAATPCHANLSLASNDPAPAPVAQTRDEAPAALKPAAAATKADVTERPQRRRAAGSAATPIRPLRAFFVRRAHCL